MDTKKKSILKALENKTCLKVISGINNFDKSKVMMLARAAAQAKASLIDICASEPIVEAVINTYPTLPVMVSSVVPGELIRAAELGATALEIGNYEALHEQGIFPNANKVRKLTEEVMNGLEALVLDAKLDANSRPLVSVTIPGHIDMLEQINLAEWLEARGINIIQTEGAALVQSKNPGALGQIEKVKLTLASTVEIARVLSERIFLVTASGLNPDTAPLAIAAGAHGIGVGKYINKLESEIEMLAAIKALQEALDKNTIQEAALV